MMAHCHHQPLNKDMAISLRKQLLTSSRKVTNPNLPQLPTGNQVGNRVGMGNLLLRMDNLRATGNLLVMGNLLVTKRVATKPSHPNFRNIIHLYTAMEMEMVMASFLRQPNIEMDLGGSCFSCTCLL